MKNILKIIIILLLIIILKDIILFIHNNILNKQMIESYYKNNTNYNYKSDMILYIPNINLKRIVKKADNNFKNLNNSLVYYKNNDYKDKIIIFGHSGLGYGTYFNRLDEVDKNNIVYIYKDNYKITYYLVNKYIVNETDTDLLYTKENNVLYLITCDKKDNKKRLVIKFYVKNIKTLRK